MKAVFLDFSSVGPNLKLDALRDALPDLHLYETTPDEQIAERIDGVEFVLGNKIRMTAERIRSNPALRFIGLTATGTDNVDLDAARECGVAVCNIRAYCTQSIVEHVFGCLLFLTRHIGDYRDAVRSGTWQTASNFCLLAHPMRELSAMTLGIVGLGELGKGVARMAEAFGMTVLVSARPGSDSRADNRVPFETVLGEADVLSLHCPLNDNTRHLIDSAALQTMQRTAILINSARGGLVDSAALVAALDSGEIAAAAIDVLPEEPPVNGDPLLDYSAPNLIVTPHVGWASNEARQASIDQLADCVSSFMTGGELNRIV